MGGVGRLGELESSSSSDKKEKLRRVLGAISSIPSKLPGMRLSKWKALFIAIVFVASLLTIFLAGTVPAQNINVVNGQKYLSQMYAEAPVPTIGYNDSFSNWSLASASPNATAHIVESPGSLTLSGTFPTSTKAMSVTIEEKFFVNLTEYPIFYTKINVSSGVDYGIRFFSTSGNGTVIPLWSNTDGLDHRPALNEFQNVQVNIPLLAKSNSVPDVSNVTKTEIYVERAAELYPTNFTLTIQSLEFLNYNLVTFQPDQTYHAVYFSFNTLPKVNTTDWVLDKINFGMSLQGSQGATYTLVQLNGTNAISGYNYEYSPSVSTYTYSLYPKNPSSIFSDSAPPDPAGSNTTSNYSIVVISLSGTLSNVKLNSVQFVYTPTPGAPVQTSPTGGDYWYLYLIFFVFLLPLTIALLLYEEFRKDNFKPYYLAIALVVGLACRFALAPVASQPFDLNIYATSARGWFEYADSNTSLGPTLPLTFFLYWLPYSFYALFLKLGFHDFFLLNQQVGFVEMIFLKLFPIIADVAIFFMFLRFSDNDKGSTGNLTKLFAIFYFLNPLSIYISSVWGQYEASTIALVVLGFLYLFRHSDTESTDHLGYLKASLAFAVSTLVELVGLIPLAFLFVKSLFAKPFDFKRPLILLAPLCLLFVYPPELHSMYLIFLSTVGASSTLLFSQPHSVYTIISNFPQILPYHPLLISLVALFVVFLIRRDFSLNNLVLFTFLSFDVFLLFAAQEPQWWVMVLPLGLLYAMLSGKYTLGVYMLSFGALVTFLILSFTQGSGYILFGTAEANLVPMVEDAAHGINIYTLGTTVAVLLALGYAILSPRESFGARTVLRASLILLGVFMLSFFWLSIKGIPL